MRIRAKTIDSSFQTLSNVQVSFSISRCELALLAIKMDNEINSWSAFDIGRSSYAPVSADA